ncbi:MAG TPA: hypothetical protein VG798_00960 [Rhizomicrobium sp.]|nr:hypothetical protein [Rhizomicrobium sp.]
MTLGFDYTSGAKLSTRTISNSAYAYSPSGSASNAYNGLNQFTTSGFAYGDGRGNLTSDGSRNFAYDLENRLTAVSGSASMTLAYDAAGRMHQTASSSTEQYLYDGDQLIAEYDSSGNLLRRYVPGQGVDETLAPLAQARGVHRSKPSAGRFCWPSAIHGIQAPTFPTATSCTPTSKAR